MSEQKLVCEHCHSSFSTKAILKTHTATNKKCLALRGLSLQTDYSCSGCSSMFITTNHLIIHQETCMKYVVEQCKKKQEEEYTKKLREQEEEYTKKLREQEEEYKKKIRELLDEQKEEQTRQRIDYINLEKEKEYLEKHLRFCEEKLNKFENMVEDLAKRGTIDNDFSANMSAALQTLRNILSPIYTFDVLSEEDIERCFREAYDEKAFMKGPEGIVDVLYRTIIRTKDGKVLMLCSDFSRKKFKMMDKNKNIIEDIGGILFCKKFGPPLRKIIIEMFTKLDKNISNTYRVKTDTLTIEKQTMENQRLQEMYIHNLYFSETDTNTDFIKYLARQTHV